MLLRATPTSICPPLQDVTFPGGGLGGHALLYLGLACLRDWRAVRLLGIRPVPRAAGAQGHEQRLQHDLGDVQNLPGQQGKFLVLLWALIAACIVYYFYFLQDKVHRRGAGDSGQFGAGDIGQLRRGVVRHPHQHLRQQPRRVRLAAGQFAPNAA